MMRAWYGGCYVWVGVWVGVYSVWYEWCVGSVVCVVCVCARVCGSVHICVCL